MTTTLIHDPLLFYPYTQTLYEGNLSSLAENEKFGSATSPADNSLMSSSPSTSSLSSINSLHSCQHDDIDWNHIMSSIKKAMYNSTGAVIPSPATYICQNTSYAPKPATDPALFYNQDILDVKDMYSYRQLRSENLLYRIFNCPLYRVDVDQTSVMRLTKGVFVANKLQQSAPTSPVLASPNFGDSFYVDVDSSFDTIDTIDTFHYDDMKRIMLQQQQQEQQQLQQDFMPFSYTFGARFSNPYHGRDVVIRGNQLPLWCQTLFLNECINRMPLEPNVPYTGLFPFAPSFTVVFQTLSTDNNINQPCYPDLTFVHERYAMEFSDPNMLEADTDELWSKQKQEIMNEMLLCDIPEAAAEVLTQLANLWATDQGLNL